MSSHLLTAHLRGEARWRELVRLLAQDLGHRIRIDTSLGAPAHGGNHGASVALLLEAVDAVDAADTLAARPLALELGDPQARGIDGHAIARCYLYVPTAYATGQWVADLGVVWINPAMGIAFAYRGTGGAPYMMRGAFGVKCTLEGRASSGGYFDRWRSRQLEAGAVKWGNGVRTAHLPGYAIASDQRELTYG